MREGKHYRPRTQRTESAEPGRVMDSSQFQQILERDRERLEQALRAASGGADYVQLQHVVDLVCDAHLLAPEIVLTFGAENAAQRRAFTKPAVRQAAGRLEKAGFVAPYEKAGGDTRHLYAHDQALRLLLALYLVRNFELKTPRAAAEVTKYLAMPRRPSTADLVMEHAFRHVLDHFASRLWAVIAREVFGADALVPGTTLTCNILPKGQGESPTDPPQVRVWLESLWLVGSASLGWLVTDRLELTRLPGPAGGVERRELVAARLDLGERKLLLMLGRPSNQPTNAGRVIARPDGETALVRFLARSVVDATAAMERDIPQHAPVVRPPGQDLILWLTAEWIRRCVSADHPSRTQCVILVPTSEQPEADYEAVASTITDTNLQEGALHQIDYKRLLSGYASAVGTTLAVRSTARVVFQELVHNYRMEHRRVGGTPLSCIAVPIPGPVDRNAPVIYVWTRQIDAAGFDVTVKALQVMAPVVGDLIEQFRRTRFTSTAATATLRTRHLPAAELLDTITHRTEELLAAAEEGADADERLTLVLLAPHGAAADHGRWLQEQLLHLIPFTFLAPATTLHPELDEILPDVISGSLNDSGEASLIFIPIWLNETGIHRLRSALPSRLNAIGSGKAGNKELVRLDVWMLDVSRSRLQRGGVRAVLGEVIAEAASTATLINDVVQAYQAAYVQGDWSQALTMLKRPLDLAPTNAYLLRRAAEFNLRLGDFSLACDYAERACTSEQSSSAWAQPTSVRAACLWADALVARGQLVDGLEKYAEKIQSDPLHPLPQYGLGQALVTVARILRQWLYDWTVEWVQSGETRCAVPLQLVGPIRTIGCYFGSADPEGPITNADMATTILRLCEFLADRAEVALLEAVGKLQQQKVFPASYRFHSMEWNAILAVGRSYRIQDDPAATARELQETITRSQARKDLLAYELLFTQMRKDAQVPEQLLCELASAGTLDLILQVTKPTASPRPAPRR